jgi:hypothetical protein
MHNFALEGLLDGGLKLRPMTLPDRFIEHGSQVGGFCIDRAPCSPA